MYGHTIQRSVQVVVYYQASYKVHEDFLRETPSFESGSKCENILTTEYNTSTNKLLDASVTCTYLAGS